MGPNETETANLKSYLEVADDWEKKMKKATQRRGGKNTARRKQVSRLFTTVFTPVNKVLFPGELYLIRERFLCFHLDSPFFN